jgi:hypothetical protein
MSKITTLGLLKEEEAIGFLRGPDSISEEHIEQRAKFAAFLVPQTLQ